MNRLLFIVGSLLIWSSASNAQNQLVAGEWFGDLKARHIGPALMSGRVSDVEMHPTNSRVVYIGTAGGGVWKSVDGGVRFNSIFDKYCQSIGTVKIDPRDPDNTVWVGTGETWTRNSVSMGDGIYKTTDGGKSWTNMGLAKSDRIASIQIHPENSNVVYVGVLGALWGDSEERGVFKTTDGGKTWTKILFVNAKTGCSDLIIDPNNPNTLYASFWEFRRTAYSFSSGGNNSAIYKSTDGGATWNKIHKGIPNGQLGRIALAISPSKTNVLYAVVEAEKAEEKGLYRSEDGGNSWQFLCGDFGLTVRPFYFSRITVDPKNPDIIAKAGLFGSISRDGGKTFKNLGAMHSDIHDIAFDPKDSDKLFVATDGGLYRSFNGGTTMEIIENLPLSQFYHVSIDNRDPYYVFGGLQDNNSWFGPSASPGGVEARDWELVGAGDGFRVYPHPTKPHIVYSEMQGADAIWRFNTQDQQLKVIKPYPIGNDPKLRFNWNAAFTTSRYNPDRLYAGSQFLHVSNDMGDSWTKISPDLTTNDPNKQNASNSGGLSADNSGAENHCTIFTIAESPRNEQVIWVGTDDGNVQVTRDGGKNWTNVTANISGLPKNTWCYHIEASIYGEGIAYAVFDGHAQNDYQAYIYKTSDFGQTWKSIATKDIPMFVRSLQEDYKNPDLLFAGAETGLFVTLNGGLNWSKFENNFPAVAVHYLEMHPITNDLIAATHGRGIIIIDDISPLRELKAEVLSKNLQFIPTSPKVMTEKSSFGGTSSEVQFVGDNPSTNFQIKYVLSKRHTFGKMSMEIVDKAGNLVATLQPGKQKGINIVEWGFNGQAPKVAKGKTLAFQAGFAPRVKAGKYVVRITKGTEVFEQEIEVKYDPKSPFSLEERTKQQEVTKQLFDFTQELAYLVYQIDQWDAAIDQFSLQNSAPNKAISDLNQELDALRDGLVITKGDNYVGAGEPQLREKLGDIYSTIASYYGAPSSTQLENIAMLKKQFDAAKAKFEALNKKQIPAATTVLSKAKIQKPIILPFSDFLKAEN
ncbi:MAG: hypothetical protein RL264_1916 [Bacteroidota bacterium]|jgi:photosystem II stability/assembly factor-like uncharacterized protein